MAQGIEIIPELCVQDIPAARAMLSDVFGFVADGYLMRLGSQRIALVQATGPVTHGKIDHLALAAGDVPAALAAFRARGAVLEGTTPHGPNQIAEFWDNGIAYVFLCGPEGARFEFCARLPHDARPGLPGHDHIGIPCTDIAASVAFFQGLGLSVIHAVRLDRPEGATEVRFLSAGGSVVELYEPPELRGTVADFAPNALWAGLRVMGSAHAAGPLMGPDGLRLTVI